MKRLEVIDLGSSGGNQEQVESHLRTLIDEVEEVSGKQMVKAYRHAAIATYFTIHLRHDSTRAEENPSPLGVLLASALREFGMVNHSVWIEMDGHAHHRHAGKNANDSETLQGERRKPAERRKFK